MTKFIVKSSVLSKTLLFVFWSQIQPFPPRCWGQRHAPLHLVHVMLAGTQDFVGVRQTLCQLGYSPSPKFFLLKVDSLCIFGEFDKIFGCHVPLYYSHYFIDVEFDIVFLILFIRTVFCFNRRYEVIQGIQIFEQGISGLQSEVFIVRV